jgi:tetratricopeptide (TPR) repeat protein
MRSIGGDSMKALSYFLAFCFGLSFILLNQISFASMCFKAIAEGDDKKAIVECSKEIKANPNESSLYNMRGLAYGKNNQHKLAIQDFTKAIQIATKNGEYYSRIAGAYSNRGHAFQKAGQYDLAVKDFTKAVEIDSSSFYAYLGRGFVYILMGKYNNAEKDLNDALQIDPNSNKSSTKFCMAQLYSMKSDANKACRWLKEAMAEASDAEKSFFKDRLSDKLFDNIRNTTCFKIITFGAVKVDPEKIYEAGNSAYESRDYKKAISLLEEAIEAGLSGEFLQNAQYNLYWSTFMLDDVQRMGYYQAKCESWNRRFKFIVKHRLHYTAISGWDDIVEKCLDMGDDINATNENGLSALYICASKGCVDVVKVLLERGADKEFRSPEGRTPLIAAASEWHFDVVDLLINNGADVNAKDNSGLSVLYHALESKTNFAAPPRKIQMVQNLEEAGANFGLTSKNVLNRTWLDFVSSVKNGNLETAYNLCSKEMHLQGSFGKFKEIFSQEKARSYFCDIQGVSEEYTANDKGLLYVRKLSRPYEVCFSPLRFVLQDGKWKILDL